MRKKETKVPFLCIFLLCGRLMGEWGWVAGSASGPWRRMGGGAGTDGRAQKALVKWRLVALVGENAATSAGA
jgi:hypothetical protein